MKGSYWHEPTGTSIDMTPDFQDPTVFEVNRVFTPAGSRGQGGAKALAEQVIADADAEGITLTGWINPYGPMDEGQLASFYQRFGAVADERGIYTRTPGAGQAAGDE